MKSIIFVALAIVAVAVAAPAEEPAKILRSDFQQQPDGGYVFGFETENGINRQENGELREAFDEDNKPHQVLTVRGSFSYTGNDGKPEIISYYADETGYHAEGESIPKVARK